VSFRRGRKRERADEAGAGMGAARPGSPAPILALQLRSLVRALRRRAERPCSSPPFRNLEAFARVPGCDAGRPGP
jgi:hypothetical protein